MKFYAAHLSFYKPEQRLISPESSQLEPIDLAGRLLMKNPIFNSEGKHRYADLMLDNFVRDEDGNLVAAFLGRGQLRTVPDHSDDVGYFQREQLVHPYLYFLWDRKNQGILIQKDTRVYSNYESVFNSLESHLNNLLSSYAYLVRLEALSEKSKFWECLENFDRIYSVRFELGAPNLFGLFNEDLSKDLKAIRESFNAETVVEEIDSNKGDIKIEKGAKKVNEYLDWINIGGGNWNITGKRNDEKSSKKISSKVDENLIESEIIPSESELNLDSAHEILEDAKKIPLYDVSPYVAKK